MQRGGENICFLPLLIIGPLGINCAFVVPLLLQTSRCLECVNCTASLLGRRTNLHSLRTKKLVA